MTAAKPRIETRIRQRIIDAWQHARELPRFLQILFAAIYAIPAIQVAVGFWRIGNGDAQSGVLGVVVGAAFLALFVYGDSSSYRTRS